MSNDRNVALFDTETTSLIANSLISDKHQPRVVEFYGAIIDPFGEKIRELSFLCNPGVPIPKEAQEITGITDEMVKSAPPFGMFEKDVRDFFASADVAVAHNLAYDKAVIDGEMRRLGVTMEWPPVLICTVEETEWVKGFRLSLSALHEHLFNETFADAHRAQTDVDALIRCWVTMSSKGWV